MVLRGSHSGRDRSAGPRFRVAAGIIASMTDRGLPIVDGAPACPFVAFEDDRDERATSPDHRHRCYAEIRPAPRAQAHQEAYCLSANFPVCPTFQDWARREAARARDARIGEADRPGDVVAGASEPPRRNPPRDWAAPPPWAEGAAGGLAGSVADRLARGGPADREAADDEAPETWTAEEADEPEAPLVRPSERAPVWERSRDASAEAFSPPVRPEAESERRPLDAAPPAASRPVVGGSRRRAEDRGDRDGGPSWERPRRMEAYPVIKRRIGLPSVSVPSIVLLAVAVLLAAVALFYLPALLGVGGPGPTASPTGSVVAASPSVEPSASVEPSPSAAATPTVYTVQSGDTLQRIANRFGVTLQAVLDANPQITDPNKIKIGDQITIPTGPPNQVPGVSPSAEPSPS
jgi:LysM repeat protein